MEQPDFFEAVRGGDASAVAHLLECDPDLARVSGEHAKTGLHWAAECDQPEIAAPQWANEAGHATSPSCWRRAEEHSR